MKLSPPFFLSRCVDLVVLGLSFAICCAVQAQASVEPPSSAAQTLHQAYAELTTSGGASLNNVGSNCPIRPAGSLSNSCRIGIWTYAGATRNGEQNAEFLKETVTGSGIDLGGLGGWTTKKLHFDTMNSAVRGITDGSNLFLSCHGIGDCFANYDYIGSDGGLAADSDESVGAYEAVVAESPGYFHGTAPKTYAPGALEIDLTHTAGSPWTTDGTFLIDTSRDVLTAVQSGPSKPLPGSELPAQGRAALLNYLPLQAAVLPVTANLCYALSTGKPLVPPANIPATSSVPVTIACSVQPIRGAYTPFPPQGHVCVAGDVYPEQATIAAAGILGPDHVQVLTLNLRNPHNSLAVFLGDPCGRYLSFDAEGADNGMRQLFPVYGSLTGSDLIYGDNLYGSIVGRTIPYPGMVASQTTSSNRLHLYHGAEIVGNRTTAANPTLEPNTMQIQAGDTLENPHYAHVGAKAIGIDQDMKTPCTPGSNCDILYLAYTGTGATQGSVFIHTATGNPSGFYHASGGKRTPPIWARVEGPHANLFSITEAPQGGNADGSGGDLIHVGPPPGDASSPYDLFSLEGGPHGTSTELRYNPANGTLFTPRFLAGSLAAQNGYTGTFPAGACTVIVKAGIITGVTGC